MSETTPESRPPPSGPDTRSAATRRVPSRALAALFALLVLAPGIFERELMPPDEPRYALVASEMYASGDLVLPTRHGEPYLEKPPLLFWAAAAAFHLSGGPSEAAARIPSLFAAALLAVLVAGAARRWYDAGTGCLASLILTTSSLMLLRSGWVVTDTLLAAAVFGCVASLDAVRRRGGRVHAWTAAFWLAAGLLAKGPVALLLVILAAVASLAAPGPRLSLLPLVRPGPLALLSAALIPWPLALASRTGEPGALLDGLLHQTVTRFADSWDNLEPWWYYGEALLLGLLPWSLLAPLFLDRAVRRRVLAAPVTRWLLTWGLLTAIVLSVPSGKRGVYLLPVFPAFAIVAAQLVASTPARWTRLLVSATAAIASSALAAVAFAFTLDPRGFGLLPDRLPDGADLRFGIVVVSAIWGAGLAGMSLAAARYWRLVAVAPLAAALMAGLSAPFVSTPALDDAQGARHAASQIAAWTPAGAAVGICRSKRELLDWYLPQAVVPLERPAEVARFLEGPGTRIVACREEQLLPGTGLPAGSSRVGTVRIGRLTLHVVRAASGRSRDGPRGPPEGRR